MAYRSAHKRQRSCSDRVSTSHNISAGRDAAAQTGEAARLLGLGPEVAGAELQPRLAAAAGQVPVPAVQPQPGHLQAGRHRAAAPRQGLLPANAEVQELKLETKVYPKVRNHREGPYYKTTMLTSPYDLHRHPNVHIPWVNAC